MTESTERKSNFPVKWFAIGCSFLVISAVCLIITALIGFIRPLFITVGPDEVAVIVSPYEPTGYRMEPLHPGNRMLRPWESAYYMKITKTTFDSSKDGCDCDSTGAIKVHTRDGVDMIVNYRVTYSVDPNQAVNIFIMWKDRYQKDFVVPVTRGIIGKVTSQYASGELALTKNDTIEKEIFSQLEPRFTETHLFLFDFKIDDVRLKQ